MIRDIAGHQNHTIKLVRKLQKKKYRRERGLLVAEGLDLLVIAIEAGADVKEVLVRSDLVGELPETVAELAGKDALNVGVCSEELLSSAGSLGGGADVIFVSSQPAWSLADVPLGEGVALWLDEVGDPGNVGTLVRSCVAFGVTGMICSPGTADPYGPKAMRAGMGAQFLMPVVVEVSAADLLARVGRVEAAGGSTDILVADSRSGDDIEDVAAEYRAVGDSRDKGLILVLGGERLGPGEAWRESRRVCIPQRRFDSLNVAMAGTILLYSLAGPRSGKQGVEPIGL